MNIDAANSGRRLDTFVRQLLPQVSLGCLMKWIRTGRIRCNNRKVRPDYRLQEGDVLLVPEHPVLASENPVRVAKTKPMPEVVYEDTHLLVVNKPPGMVCHVGTLHDDDSLMHRVEGYLGSQHALPGMKPGLAQRLDKEVSGLVPIGKNAPVLRALGQQVASGEACKTYYALVLGHVRAASGVIDVPLRVDDQPMGNKPRVFADPVHGKPACTLYETVSVGKTASFLRVTITTGRTHQIRAHLAHIGHSLLGDPRYGDAAVNARLKETYGLNHICLHAGRLVLTHPVAGERLEFTVPYPVGFVRVAKGCGVLLEQEVRGP